MGAPLLTAGGRAAAFQRRPGAFWPFLHRFSGAPMQPRILRQAQKRLPGGAADARVVRAVAAPSPEQRPASALPGQIGD